MNDTNMPLPVRLDSRLRPPAGFEILASVNPVALDGVPAWHLRYQRNDGQNGGLGGEHYSMVLSQSGQLLGKTWFSADQCHGTLPTAAQAQRIAYSYLEQHAPDLLPGLALQWVQPHQETLRTTLADGQSRSHTLTGMKVKCLNEADGRYFWVIVGPGGVVLTFERNIVWDFARSLRQTEKWLHDSWLTGQLPALA
jgi:hypothetical protein